MYKLGRLGLAAVFALLSVWVLGTPLQAQSSGNVDVTAQVGEEKPEPEPISAPTISEPANNTTFAEKNIKVTGGCTSGLIVKVFSNANFVGSTVCASNNTYELQVDLFVERNELKARQYDILNQPSPESGAVVVFYLPQQPIPPLPDPTPDTPGDGDSSGGGSSGGGTPGSAGSPTADAVAEFQLAIDYDYTSQGGSVGQPFRLPIHFVGGTPPYTISIDWGDGSVNNFVRQNTDDFVVEYVYSRAGLYIIVITITDSNGQVSRLQFVVLMHGDIDKAIKESFFGQGSVLQGFQNATPAVTTAIAITFALGVTVGVFFPVILRFTRSLVAKVISFVLKIIKQT